MSQAYEAVTVPVLVTCKLYERDGMVPGPGGMEPVRIFKAADFDYVRVDELSAEAQDLFVTAGLLNGPAKSAQERRWFEEKLPAVTRQPKLVCWQRDGRFIPGVLCPTTESASAVYLLLRQFAAQGVAICPQCSRLFMQKRPDQAYCSTRHREAHRQQLFRKRAKR